MEFEVTPLVLTPLVPSRAPDDRVVAAAQQQHAEGPAGLPQLLLNVVYFLVLDVTA